METGNASALDGDESSNPDVDGTATDNTGATGGTNGSDANGDIGANDPAKSASPRKRGRPAGGKRTESNGASGKTATEQKTKSNIFVDKNLLGQQLVGIHAMAAVMTKQPIIAITDKEGEALAKSLVDIADHYKLTASKGILLWVNFGAVAAMIYGPKVMPLIKTKPREPRATPSLVPSTTLNFGEAVKG